MGRDDRLREIDARLDRLERLALLSYNQIRDVARYAHDGIIGAVEYAADAAEDALEGRPPESLPKARTIPNAKPLSDTDLLSAGISMREIVELKRMLLREFVGQTRADVLAIAHDLVPAQAREPVAKPEVDRKVA